MISSISNLGNAFGANPYRRAAQAVVNQDTAVGAAEEAALRAINQVGAGDQGTEVANSLSQDDRGAVNAKEANLQQIEDDQDLVGATASLLAEKTALRASVAVLKTADRMTGSLLDIFA